jgi:hypothetical protein
VAAPFQRPPTGRPVPVAADTAGRWQCPRRTHQPSGHQPSGHPSVVPDPAGDSHRVRGVRFHPETGRGVRLPDRLRRTRSRHPPRDGSAARVALAGLRWSRLARLTRPAGYRLSGRADTGRGPPDTGSPHAPALRTPATAQGRRTLRQWRCWIARTRGVHHRSHVRPEWDRNVRRRPAPLPDRQIRWLVFRWMGRRSRRVETVPLDRLDDQRNDQAAGWQSTTAGPVGPPAAKWPHPDHGPAAERRASRRPRRSDATVGITAMGPVPSHPTVVGGRVPGRLASEASVVVRREVAPPAMRQRSPGRRGLA